MKSRQTYGDDNMIENRQSTFHSKAAKEQTEEERMIMLMGPDYKKTQERMRAKAAKKEADKKAKEAAASGKAPAPVQEEIIAAAPIKVVIEEK